MKRQLNEDEVRLSKSNIVSLTEDMKYAQAMVKYYDLQINELLTLNFNRKIKEFKDLKKQILNEIELCKNIISETQKQIKEGVEVKDEKSKEK